MKRKVQKVKRAKDCTCCIGMLVGATGPDGVDQHADDCNRKKCDSCTIHVVAKLSNLYIKKAKKTMTDKSTETTVETPVLEIKRAVETPADPLPVKKYPGAVLISELLCVCGFPWNRHEPFYICEGKLICLNCAQATVTE